ncbi:MAG TPA: hypothetical protein VN605_12700, partial [Thermoanaerobaculia bacterium]|nr:hypothetical protein [Thermoanaerobaculia bacterium]
MMTTLAALLFAATLQVAGPPQLFAPGVISTAALGEAGGTFSPDGRELYFTVRTPTTTSRPVLMICFSRLIKGRWTTPEMASFSGMSYDSSPSFSPDGTKLFFVSTRSAEGKVGNDSDIWVVDREGDHWSAPRNVGAPVNTAANEQSASVAADGTLYFSSDREGGKGSFDLYRARFHDGKYEAPETLGEAINSDAAEWT